MFLKCYQLERQNITEFSRAVQAIPNLLKRKCVQNLIRCTLFFFVYVIHSFTRKTDPLIVHYHVSVPGQSQSLSIHTHKG